MIYIETRLNEYDRIEYYLKKLFPEIKIFQAKLTKEMVDSGFSADNPYVIGLNMTMEEYSDMLEKLEYIDMDEDIAGLEKSPTQAGWLRYELTNGKLFEKANGKEWRFCVVGNIIKSHTGEDGKTYYGTKAFKGGTKVYLDSKFYPSDETQISVIGMNRRGRFIIDTIPTKFIENVRFQIIYKMAAMDVMDNAESLDGWRWWGRTVKDKREAQAFAKNWYLRKGENDEGNNKGKIEAN